MPRQPDFELITGYPRAELIERGQESERVELLLEPLVHAGLFLTGRPGSSIELRVYHRHLHGVLMPSMQRLFDDGAVNRLSIARITDDEMTYSLAYNSARPIRLAMGSSEYDGYSDFHTEHRLHMVGEPIRPVELIKTKQTRALDLPLGIYHQAPQVLPHEPLEINRNNILPFYVSLVGGLDPGMLCHLEIEGNDEKIN